MGWGMGTGGTEAGRELGAGPWHGFEGMLRATSSLFQVLRSCRRQEKLLFLEEPDFVVPCVHRFMQDTGLQVLNVKGRELGAYARTHARCGRIQVSQSTSDWSLILCS